MLTLGGLLVIAGLIFWLWALFDAATATAGHVRFLPKLLWLLIIVIFMEFGALAWVLLGRPRDVAATQPSGVAPAAHEPAPGSVFGAFGQRTGRQPGPSRPGQSKARPIGPDDDPDFLSGL